MDKSLVIGAIQKVEWIEASRLQGCWRGLYKAFLPSLFLDPAYGVVAAPLDAYWGLAYGADGLLRAACAVYIQDGRAYSPWQLTFGGWEGESTLTAIDWHFCLSQTVSFLRRAGVCQWHLRMPATVYNSGFAPWHLYSRVVSGCHVIGELNHHLLIVEGKPFIGYVAASQRRYLRWAQQRHSLTRIYTAAEADWRAFFQLLSLHRYTKGMPLSLSYERLRASVELAADHLRLFTVESAAGNWLAAAIGLRVLPDVLYYFLPATHPSAYRQSPMVPLLSAMYDYAYRQGCRLLDLGTSSVGGRINEGLRVFKRRLGACESIKYHLHMLL